MVRLTWSRACLYGEMAETITATPLRVSKLATNPILSTFVSLSSRENPRPLERFVLTISPSRTSTVPRRLLGSILHANPPLFLWAFGLLLFVDPGLPDGLLFFPEALDEYLHDLRAAELRRRVLAS